MGGPLTPVGRWDAVLPYLPPSRGAAAPTHSFGSSFRDPAPGPRAASPASSSSSSDVRAGGHLPNVEDIYDMLTGELADLDANLAGKLASTSGLSAKEARLHKLLQVELGERRGVEQIGLALLGGRFDISAALADAAAASNGNANSGTESGRPSDFDPSPSHRDVTRHEASQSSARSSSSSFCSARGASNNLESGSGYPAPTPISSRAHGALSLNFKPTAVPFEFVVGTSSVKNKVKPKKKVRRPPDDGQHAGKKKPQVDSTSRKYSRPPLAPQNSRGPIEQQKTRRSSHEQVRPKKTCVSDNGINKQVRSLPSAVTQTRKGSGNALDRNDTPDCADQISAVPNESAPSEVSALGTTRTSADTFSSLATSWSATSHPAGVAHKSSATLDFDSLEYFCPSRLPPPSGASGEAGVSVLEKTSHELNTSNSAKGAIRVGLANDLAEPASEGARIQELTETAGFCNLADPQNTGQSPRDEAMTGFPSRDTNSHTCDKHIEEENESSRNICSRPDTAEVSPRDLPEPYESACTTDNEANEDFPTICSKQDAPNDVKYQIDTIQEQGQHDDTNVLLSKKVRPSSAGSDDCPKEDGNDNNADEYNSERSQLAFPTADPLDVPISARSSWGNDGIRMQTGSHGDMGASVSDLAPTSGEVIKQDAVAPGKPKEQRRGSRACSGALQSDTANPNERPSRRPPLPHDALRPREKHRNRSMELDLMDLDISLIEKGGVQDYSEMFPSIGSIFTWGRSPNTLSLEHKERALREALQVFSQFCGIVGSLDDQFSSNLAPADHATPAATQNALSALNSRGSGLYGIFLKGIIDRISDGDEYRAPSPQRPPRQELFAARYYKVVQNRTEVYDIVTRVFHRLQGWEELPHGLGLSNVWNLCWTWSKPKLDYSRLCSWQKINHFPENKHLTRKDCLKRTIDRYTRTGGKFAQYFNVCPKTFVLPKEYTLFIEHFAQIEEENEDLAVEEENQIRKTQATFLDSGVNANAAQNNKSNKKKKIPNLWIMKPAGSSRGRGIQVVNDVGSVHYGELTIIQQYISNPFLLNGYKWDMRAYVTVTSFNPLEVFMYRDGFARFTTVPFTTEEAEIENKFVHLTNTSIQRHNEDSMLQGDTEEIQARTRAQDAVLGGTKISFATLRERLRAAGVDWEVVWSRMVEVVLKSLCMSEDHIPNQANSFELFGYDLLLDSRLKVWLIEVNASPSMGQEHLLDEQVKQPLIGDTINLVDSVAFDRLKLTQALTRRLERKAASGVASSRQQLDIDLHSILLGEMPRKFGEMPRQLGRYERIAPSESYESVIKMRSALFKQ